MVSGTDVPGKRVVQLLIGVALSIGILPGAIYQVGEWTLPANRQPDSIDGIAPVAFDLAWAQLGGRGDLGMPRLSAYTYYGGFGAPGFMVAYQASRAWLGREGGGLLETRRGLTPFAATIWVSRNWSAEEAFATTLHSTHYGHGFVGLDAAALGYFGVPSAELSDFGLARLVAAARSPKWNDPWCATERNGQVAAGVLEQVRPGATLDANPVATPEGACD